MHLNLNSVNPGKSGTVIQSCFLATVSFLKIVFDYDDLPSEITTGFRGQVPGIRGLRSDIRDQKSPVKFIPVKQKMDRFHGVNLIPFLRNPG